MEIAEQVVRYGKRMQASGLTTGSGGNLSVRAEGGILITPSAMDYGDMEPEDLVWVDGAGKQLSGFRKPSSELGFHLALYAARADIGAVVHTHSPWATTLACLGWSLPAVHYLVGYAGGTEVPVAPYAPFGTVELAEQVVKGMGKGYALLLANHGLVSVGADLGDAFAVAEEIEFVAGIYLRAKAVGSPIILEDAAMTVVLEKFTAYRGLGPKTGG
ncbi:class II aldolase/adducin family protein [Desulfobotulus sp.]|jgi:L-fuculose-phosphate aldolase|uniref:class II aldolase/adducin family protein n=1 Tax=Desulfobotulus sp. TaxID=1940337 RepID=UPI002A36553A|nr:class II aldolase/adducin family protein [Desulfobotulus sp.]MDY0163182.1 class II aldolase/adducin family protein [Desulfobotulus sp.]